MPSIAITALFAAILAIIQVIFTLRVGLFRRANKISLGDGGNDELSRRIRAHGNFIETVPMALLLLMLNEMSFLSAVWLYSLGSVLVVARLMHYYAIGFNAPLVFRFIGMSSTLLVILISATLLLV